MIIRVGNERVYRVPSDAIVVCTIDDGYASVQVLLDQSSIRVRQFLVHFGDVDRSFVADEIERQLSEGCLQVSEEVM